MLEELSKKDKLWRSIAYKICGDKTLCYDLVNDMYLKMNEREQKGLKHENINDWYIWVTIKNIFLEHVRRKRKEISLESFCNIEDICDAEQILEKRIEINNALSKLDTWDREILLHTSEKSLRKLSEETGLSVMVLFHNKKNALEKLKQLL